ncbi:protein ANKUB1-like [Ciona intestinalis]
MRITIVLEDARHSMDVQPEDKVRDLKDQIEKNLLVQTIDDKRMGKFLEMKFGGAALNDDWVVQDLGLVSGSVLKCAMKIVDKPKLNVYLGYNKDTLHIMDDIDPITTTIGSIRSLLSSTLGIPVSAFNLSVNSRNSNPNNKMSKRELFDRNTMDYYGLEIGSTIILDLWDGWNELILAAISGHENVVSQYLSWDRPVRNFQQRTALYIASHRGYMGLATAMMKRGAKAHEPVGTYPGRKWCLESEHVETKKCPVHVASEKGHLPLLRLFIKISPLCFVVIDHEDRTPIQIVLRKRHRECFEYLIVRQWGRKTGKDISLPVIVYCRLLQWCERARANNLLMNGVNTSTYKGKPAKSGALVGSEVLVDGFSNKPANSIPFSEIPKPAISPEKLLPALSLAKRRLRAIRQRRSSTRSIRISSSVSSCNGSRKQDVTSTSLSRATSVSSIKGGHERELMSSGNLRRRGNGLKSCISKKCVSSESAANAENDSNTDSIFRKLPAISRGEGDRLLQHRDSRITFKPSGIDRQRNSTVSGGSVDSLLASQSDFNRKLPLPAVKKRLPTLRENTNQDRGDQRIPLPPKSLECRLRPFFYWSPYEEVSNPVAETLNRYESYRGAPARQHAVECVAVTSAFTERPWLQQIRMAVRLTRREVKKNISTKAISPISVSVK